MLDFDRQTVLGQLPRSARPAFLALWNLDLAFADVISTSSDPQLGAIRLAWWREQLDELDNPERAWTGEPRIEAADMYLLSTTNGAMLSMIPDTWAPMLNPFPWGPEVAEGLRERGHLLFGIGGRILGNDAVDAEAAGALWSLADGADHCSDPESREFLRGEARALIPTVPRMNSKLRPLTVLAALAAADLIRGGGGLARLTAAVRHRLVGTLPRS